MSKTLHADGPNILRIGFTPEQWRALLPDQRQQLFYHFNRVLSGETSAVSEWEFLGLRVDVKPWNGE